MGVKARQRRGGKRKLRRWSVGDQQSQHREERPQLRFLGDAVTSDHWRNQEPETIPKKLLKSTVEAPSSCLWISAELTT